MLYRRFGAPNLRRPPGSIVKSWIWLLLRLPFLANIRRRGRWAFLLARNLGRLVGSIKERTPMF
jgi:hypothetical protein